MELESWIVEVQVQAWYCNIFGEEMISQPTLWYNARGLVLNL